MSWRNIIGNRLKELRIVFCQSGASSTGTRNFVGNNYLEVKENFPNFPFVVRECEGVQPVVLARYDYGVEIKEFTDQLSEEEVESLVGQLVDSAEEVNGRLHF